MSWWSDLKRDLQRIGEPEKPRAERHPAAGLAARYGVDSTSASASVKNISATGVYLSTEKRLRTGELITLVLREETAAENSEELQISVHARVARQGEDGTGLSFDLPQGMNMDLWDVMVRNIVSLKDPDQVAEMFRTLRTILFLCRLCGAEAEGAIVLLGGALHPDRTATAVKIALAAESLLASEPDSSRMRAYPKLVANILRDGSWAADEVTVQLWVGLLVSSCSVDAPDDSNQIFADLLVHITSTEAKIFTLACERALASAQGTESPASGSMVLSPREMIDLTGVYDLYRNATDLAYLFNLGLMKKLFDFTSYHDADSFDITPSTLGLELYKRCQGSREKIEPHLVAVANTHLANFLPAAQPVPDNSAPPLPLPSPER